MANAGDELAVNLHDLFASLRSSNDTTHYSAPNRPESRTPVTARQSYPVASFSNEAHTPDYSQFSSRPAIMNPNNPPSRSPAPATIAEQSNADRTANLLNLLKFSPPNAPAEDPAQHQQSSASARPAIGNIQGSPYQSSHSVHGRGISASDLVASFMGKPSTPTIRASPNPPPQASKSASDLTSKPQDFLLQLLNRPKPEQDVSPSLKSASNMSQSSELPQEVQGFKETPSKNGNFGASESEKITPSSRNESPIRVFGVDESVQPTPFEPQDLPNIDPQRKGPLFTAENPFEQLAASSPRNIQRRSVSATPSRESLTAPRRSIQGMNGDNAKRRSKGSSTGSNHAASRRRLTPGGSEVLQSIESPGPPPLDDGRSQLEALMGIGAPTKDPETVAEALNEVGGQVNRQVANALAAAEEGAAEARADELEREVEIKEEELEEAQKETLDALQDKLQDAAAEIKEELEKEENQGMLEETMPSSVAGAIKDAIDEAAEGNLDNSWETANRDESPVNFVDETIVRVYDFPMRPFVSISIKQDKLPVLTFRDMGIIDVARLKKEFDQIDRILSTATSDFILYAMPKPGGLRVIRQDDGLDQQIFRETKDRIFNLSVCTGPSGHASRETQTVIATAVSGSVYWATIGRPNENLVRAGNMEKNGLIFPPAPAQDENPSGGQLKTRAKKSSRHPEFFAIGRGKSIQIVFPLQAQTSRFVDKNLVVDTEGYFRDRSLRINTGKAGKDFTFSEDDSTITTLDKAGRLRLWDIRDLVHEGNASASKLAPIEIKSPILTFNTAVPNEKSWPTSVLFVDKLRPYSKGTALRYIIVGMKQNHTLQLWDLGLGKAVQELHFPHDNESDAICSVSYHPASGMIVVGHPTRNSIYLIHLSAPRYNLPPMSQAKFVQRLANKDSTLPKPEATAIMSGMREYTMSHKGQLRSIDLLPASTKTSGSISVDDDPTLFELYVMHSKGVTCFSINKEDLGWSKDNKVLHPVDAEEAGQIVLKDLREPQSGHFSEASSINGDAFSSVSAAVSSVSKPSGKEHSKKSTVPAWRSVGSPAKNITESTEQSIRPGPSAINGSATSGPDKQEKKKRRAAMAENRGSDAPHARPAEPIISSSYADVAQRARSPISKPFIPSTQDSPRPTMMKTSSIDAPEVTLPSSDKTTRANMLSGDSINLGISGDFLDKEFKKIEKGVSGEFSKALNQELDTLYRRFDEDKRVQDAAGAAKQDAILRLVSSTLSDNVEKSLSRIISNTIQQVVVPSIAEVTASTLNKNVSEMVGQQLHQTIVPQLKIALPDVMSKAVQHPEVLRLISDQLAHKVASRVENEFAAILHNTISPTFKTIVITTAQNASAETERRVGEQLQQAEVQHRNDSVRIDQLMALVRGLSETVHTMAAAQSEFQQEILKLQQQSHQERQASSSRTTSSQNAKEPTISSVSSRVEKSPEQEELEAIASLMTEGQFEEGTIQVRSF